jgi:nicotinamide-nucleotide amidase
MKIELICTGSELLAGKVNTNAAYIGSRLYAIGFELSLVTDVGDRKQDLLQEFKRAFERSTIVIITGGLGPTFDDITVETAAECLNLEIYPDEKVLNSIKEYFLKRSAISIPKINKKQANIIRGAKVLENRFGTAPGQMLHFKFKNREKKCRKTLFLLPGPPGEMKPMFEENVEPFLKSYSVGIKKNGVLHVFGITESAVEELIKPVMEEVSGNSKSVEFSILASISVIDIKFSVSGTEELLVDETISKLKLGFGRILKDNIFGSDNDTLASVAGQLLLENKKTVSFAESCTGGNIAAAVTDIPGSSLYFKSSIVAYSNESKIKLLGVKKETLTNFGDVSKETAKEMAEGVLKLSDSNYAFSVTGIAGPNDGIKEKPVGLVYIGSADKEKTESFKFNFNGTRTDIRKRTVNTVLDLLRRKLIVKHFY